MKEIRTERLLLRPFRESDYDDLFEFLFQLKDDEFEGYPGSPTRTAGSIWRTGWVRRNFTPRRWRVPAR